MAKKLPESECNRLAADFDPPAAKNAHGGAPPLKGGKRVRVTASLTSAQYELLKKLAKKRSLPMSRVLGAAVEGMVSLVMMQRISLYQSIQQVLDLLRLQDFVQPDIS